MSYKARFVRTRPGVPRNAVIYGTPKAPVPVVMRPVKNIGRLDHVHFDPQTGRRKKAA